ncbi:MULTISPECIES: GAF domain-containing sensor histidine kinase [Leptolyngbya]|uniref:histidine kinase n=2 Tax=Leptolyngbya boryana TaxID=1184 RepID=A0A1Z4JE09_LEPBY|nr:MULTISPECIES: GAF domain-containing sensor histidine kinase [Leptolyngbya]BAY54961.1 GAF sensor signal transduction histidine kinase [Leptolyngbya boryana NIES-2135]MBD2365940.1 GAF domain-containing sensor histidine kinase [Leptolyngbya sp. FACHB-161]MBD2372120.1 GAF domain-containing sensor histidine kinase [Leptolyngbya sp. FACHB-238]MBD2396544.1 GAF domain-containing sensor histidine kinase [Leptolyngbya sp. FACHB-239]MBD2403066.1 GAF domain-containing sensor histidine kinase [Leptolyng
MGIPDNRLFCRLDGLTTAAREQQRMLVLTELGLLDSESVPIFEETTQTAAHSLDAPICLIGLMDQSRQWFKSAQGLSRLGLMNDLAMTRQLPREEAFCVHVVDSQQVLAIDDTLEHPVFANSLLCQQYGIRAYLGAPLITVSGDCIGTLCIMDSRPRNFTERDAEFLMLAARLSMSEYERLHLIKSQAIGTPMPVVHSQPVSANPVKFELLAQLTQELRTPLTSVMGMASVLNREIYGPLTSKQKEYLDIIHHSGQYLLSLVKEILELSQLDDSSRALNLASIDIEMLCQQAISTLEQAASRREQQIRLSVEPGNRIWLLDKEKIRQMLYHLMFSVIQASNAGSIVRLHVSHKSSGLRLSVWASHPCLGDGIGYNEMLTPQTSPISTFEYEHSTNGNRTGLIPVAMPMSSVRLADLDEVAEIPDADAVRKNLGLLLSRQLAEMHGGQILIQGVAEPGYRYVITLPRLTQ